WLDEPASADALFLKAGDDQRQPPQLYFVAGRVAWLPEKPTSQRGISPSHVALAKARMDAGLWGSVRGTNRAPLGDSDREAFYQLLAALQRPVGEVRTAEDRPLDVVSLLQQPGDWQGSLLPLQGRTQRIMRVAVVDPDIQSRFGLDHYYE